MGEVAEMFDVNPSLIRFWEQKFDILRPHKNKKGNRLFTTKDVDNLKIIYHLVKERGMTLEGARKRMKENREGTERDFEVIEKLQNIKTLLLEIKAELGTDGTEEYIARNNEEDIVVKHIEDIEPTIESDQQIEVGEVITIDFETENYEQELEHNLELESESESESELELELELESESEPEPEPEPAKQEEVKYVRNLFGELVPLEEFLGEHKI